MSLPGELAARIATACGADAVAAARPVAGGSINAAFEVEFGDGRRVFVKTRPDAPPGEYATEAAALRWLAEPGVLAVPAPVGLADGADGVGGADGADFLALEWVAPGALGPSGAEELGRGLAALHAAGAAAFGAPPPGAPIPPGDAVAPLTIGSVTLPNDPLPDWPSFYAERRLRPLARTARDRGGLSAAAARDIERVCERLGALAGPPEPPARLHGDLWTGNVLGDVNGRPWLIDPAAYGGHREIDLAMLALFGSGVATARVIASYEDVAPLAPGHAERVELWQLFPLLVHAALFGGGYGESAHRAARRYVGAR